MPRIPPGARKTTLTMASEIAFILPAYNAAATIAQALSSIQSQTFVDWEAWVIDDASSDATFCIASQFAMDDGRIHVIAAPGNQGVSAARNAGIAASDSRYIAFLDADDIALPDRARKQKLFLDEADRLSAVGSAIRLFGSAQGDIHPTTQPDEVGMRLLFSCEVFITSMMIRRESIEKLMLEFDPGYKGTGEDWLYLSELIMRGGRIANLPEVLTCYRRHPSQATGALRDTVDCSATRLRADMLVWLGVKPEHQDLAAHVAISPCYWELVRDVPLDAFDKTRLARWCQVISRANNETGRFPQAQFDQVLKVIHDDAISKSCC